MEFAVFVQTFLPGPQAHDPRAEHRRLLDDLEIIKVADRSNFKYAWVSEHHCLTEYSHLSASESFIPFALAQTEQIHVGSAIWPLNPITNHPVRLAERAAMCDHLSHGRFEFGTGRGAGSWEVGVFNLLTSETKVVWEEVIWEFKKMWDSVDYVHDGASFQTPGRNILPKPYGGGRTHPAMWVAAGNTPTYEKAARHGIGVLGFNVGSVHVLQECCESYKSAIKEAEPVGQFVNDNIMVTNGMPIVLRDSKDARKAALQQGQNVITALVYLYHDTFPFPDGAKKWPERLPDPTPADVDWLIDNGFLLCGSPDEVVEQLGRYEAVGFDQLAFGTPMNVPQEIALESIALFGTEVIPKFDRDPIHRTTRMRYGDQAEQVVQDHARAEHFDSSTVLR
jgi:alkanesulfonate monooxygenase SsuD/methylene tetrahydromethanopterin reductase-like flavin-dependent oxidoreductase (luciferase family)